MVERKPPLSEGGTFELRAGQFCAGFILINSIKAKLEPLWGSLPILNRS